MTTTPPTSTTTPPTSTATPTERDTQEDRALWGIPQLAMILTWLEEFVTTLSGPMLTLGLAIGLIDMLTDGKLFLTSDIFVYAYAISQAIGVDGQLIGSAFRLSRAFHKGKIWEGLLFSVLVLSLAYVAYLAGWTLNYQQTFGTTTAQALGTIGIDKVSWVAQRAGISVILVVLSGIMRYMPKKKVELTDELDEIDRRRQIDAAKRAAAKEKLTGWVSTGKAALQTAQQAKTEVDPSKTVEPITNMIELPVEPVPNQSNEVGRRGAPTVKAAPQPGTKAFNSLVYTTGQSLVRDDRLSIFNIAQALSVEPDAVQAAISILQQERIGKLKPGKDLPFDSVLSVL